MAQERNIHPYIPGAGQLVKPFTQFRKAMPAKVDAATLKRLALAPGNESMVLGVLRFLDLIDENGNRTDAGRQLFVKHDDAQFSKALEAHVRKAYKQLFDDRGEDAWALDRDTLIGVFRTIDETSALTAKRQAIAFETLAAFSGHGEVAKPNSASAGRPKKSASSKDAAKGGKITAPDPPDPKAAPARKDGTTGGEVGLTVRIEVNLPAQADQETYDRIFKSIRANLLNG